MKENNNLRNEKLLIVGGTGFIGESIAKEALKCSFNVTIISKNKYPLNKQLKGIRYFSLDITNKVLLLSTLNNVAFNYVINVSGYVDHTNYFNGGNEVLKVHFDGTVNLINCINQSQLRKFIQIGSSDEYGNGVSPQNEDQRELPISPYSFAKTASTQFLQMLHRTEGFPVVIIRPFLVYGPGQNTKRFIPQIITGCINNKEFAVSKGLQLRDFCYITDFVRAIFLTLPNQKINGSIINIASGRPVMIKEVINKIVSLIGSGNPKFGEIAYRNGENMKLYADIRKAKVILGWQPKVNLESGLIKTIKWMKAL